MSKNSGNKSFGRRRAEQQVNIGSFSSSEKENLVVDIILVFFFLFLPPLFLLFLLKKEGDENIRNDAQKSTRGIKVFWDLFVVVGILLEIYFGNFKTLIYVWYTGKYLVTYFEEF